MPKGTTSACAENTVSLRASSRVTRNYLRVRGEYWGCGGGGQWVWNYLRVRGEYPPFFCAPNPKKELPPRARRIPTRPQDTWNKLGTTSACAENTKRKSCGRCCTWNYLRVRGEYRSLRKSPPPIFGTTSACAENTEKLHCELHYTRNYLRVRGEYVNSWENVPIFQELPPRARRIPVAGPYEGFYPGTTSACAENTVYPRIRLENRRNYLRVRGEYRSEMTALIPCPELPPRARRIQHAPRARR